MVMEKELFRKKIFNLVKKSSRIEMESLRKEEILIRDNVESHKKVIKEKKEKISTIKNKMFLEDENGSLDLELLSQYRSYMVLLQDELLRDEMLSNSLNKRHQLQLRKVKEKFQQARLYENMANKSQVEITAHLTKLEEKEAEELAGRFSGESF